MHFINKNTPAKWDEMFIWEKNVPPKQDPGFMKVEIPVRWENLFLYKQI